MSRLVEIAVSAKASAILALTTFASGILNFVGIIPNDVFSKCATLVGIILSGIMAQYWRNKIYNEKINNALDLERKAIEIETARLNLEAAREHHRRAGDK